MDPGVSSILASLPLPFKLRRILNHSNTQGVPQSLDFITYIQLVGRLFRNSEDTGKILSSCKIIQCHPDLVAHTFNTSNGEAEDKGR